MASPDQPEDSPPSRSGLGPWAPIALVLLALHFGSFFDAGAPIQTDTRYYVYFARVVAEGGVPHLDYFDNKTQLASLVGGAFHAVGTWIGVEPLSAIRAGYLGLVALGGWLAFALYRRLFAGEGTTALLALLPYLGFTYLGRLPAVGNVPKVIVAVAISGAALALLRRRFLLAGAVAALAPLDWQIGVLVPLGILVGAALGGERRRALTGVVLGGGGVALLFTGYLVTTGSLGAFWEHTVGSAFARGEGPFAAVEILVRRLRSTSGGELWLLAPALLGLLSLPRFLRHSHARGTRGARVALLLHHAGVVAFSLRDFQGSGDTMLLLHTLAFLGAVGLGEGHGWLSARLAAPRTRRRVSTVALLALLVAVHPALGARPPIVTRDSPEGARLEHQRAFRSALEPVVRDRRVLLLGPSELLFLEPFPTLTPFIYWNNAAAHVFAREHGEASVERGAGLARLIEEQRPDVLITKLFFDLPPALPYAPLGARDPGLATAARALEASGPYRVRVLVRTSDE